MKYKILSGCVVLSVAMATSSAQTKSDFSGKCDKPDVQQSVPAGDKDGHVFLLMQGKCTVKGEVSGVAAKEATYSQHGEVTGKRTKTWGVYVATFDNGDKIFYNYQEIMTANADGSSVGTNKYQVTVATGKMKGVTGSGTCKLKGASDGSVEYSCTGEYTAGGAAAKKK
jgi:hypothetical protein